MLTFGGTQELQAGGRAGRQQPMDWFRVASKFGLIIFGSVCAPYIKILAFLGAFLKPT
jgi:hypothetical protein